MAEEKQFGGLDVVAPLDADACGEQARVEVSGGAPYPAPHVRPRPDRPGQIGLVDHGPLGQPVPPEGDEPRAAVLGGVQCPFLVHECECGTGH